MPKVLFGSWQPDVASIDTQGSSYVHNVIPNASGYGPLRSLLAFADALPARCLGLFGVLDDDNSSHVFAGTSTKLYKLNAVTRAWDDVTRASGGDYNVGSREYWDFELFGQIVVAVTNDNDPQKFTLGTSSAFEALGGSPPKARRVAVVKDQLVLSGLTDNPNRIQWSDLNNIEQWTVGTGSADYQDFPDGGYTIDVAGGEYGLVFQENAIRRMAASDLVFDFSRISEGRGLFMPYSLVSMQGVSFFYSSDGFYRIDSAGALQTIGENRIDQTIKDSADLTNPRFMIGQADPQSKRIYWAYKSVGNTNENYLDKLLIYDWQRNQWTQGSINLEYLSASSPLSATLEGLDTLGDLDSLTISLDLYQSTPVFKLTGVSTAHAPGYFEGDALEATLDLPEAAIGNELNMVVNGVRPISDAPSAYIKVGKRPHLDASVDYSDETAISSRGVAPQRVNGRFLTGRLRIPAGTSWTYARGLDVGVITAGLR